MLKKFVSTVVGVSCAVAALGVSATSPTIQTTTTYSGSGPAKIEVTTTVTGAASGNVYTYLAYDKGVATVPTRDQIVYVDQQKATGTNVTFNYVTDSANIESNVKVGGKSAAGEAYTPTSGTIPAAPGNVSVTVNGIAASDVTVDMTATSGTYVSISYTDANPVNGVTVDGTEVDWFAGNGVVWVKVDALKNVTKPTVAITTAAAATVETQTLASGYMAAAGEDDAAVIALGQVTGDVAEYGIAFSTDSNFTSPKYLQALGRNNEGQFAIKWVGYGSELTGTVYAKVYTGVEGRRVLSEKTYEVIVGGTDDTPGSIVK